jgi:hypothetical protein
MLSRISYQILCIFLCDLLNDYTSLKRFIFILYVTPVLFTVILCSKTSFNMLKRWKLT